MLRRAAFILVVLTMASGVGVVAEQPSPAIQPAAVPGDWMLAQRAGAGGVPPGAFANAAGEARALRELTAGADPALAAAPWESLGPRNIGGRVTDLTLDDRGAVYAAAASGGVWKSSDLGVTFSPAWPDDLTQPVGAVAWAGDGTLYAGTGEANPGGGSLTFGGTGVYRSRDRGATWSLSGLPDSGAIGRIAADPHDPRRVFVAAAGNLFVPGGGRGLYRTTDGGETWQLVLPGANDTTGAVDLAIDPQDPRRVYAAMWDHLRTPARRIYGGPGSGLYRSTDGGESWERLPVGSRTAAVMGRIGVAVSASDPNRVYATVIESSGAFGGIWRSDDRGDTWLGLGRFGQTSQSTYGWWFGRLWVDPSNRERVFVAGVDLAESIDGGVSFSGHTSALQTATGSGPVGLHADQHAMAWDSSRPGLVYVGNDGGVYRSEAAGAMGTWVGALSQGWTQHYTVDHSERDPSVVVTGLQDNRCQRNFAAGAPGGAAAWEEYAVCGDGLETLVDPVTEAMYSCSQYGSFCMKTVGAVSIPMGNVPGRKGWWMPLVIDPADVLGLYAGSNVVARSPDGGVTWRVISPDLSSNPPSNDFYPYGTVTTVAATAADPRVVYAGTDEGFLWTTKDRGATWTRLHDPDLPEAWVTRVHADQTNAQVAYAAFSGYRSGDGAARLLRTSDGGASWEDVSGDLPHAPVNDVAIADGALVAATDVGVFLSRDGGGSWLAPGTGLPLVPVTDLRYHPQGRTLTAATFGRGIMRVALP